MDQSEISVLSQEELDRTIEEGLKGIRKTCAMFNRGFLSEEDRDFRTGCILDEGFRTCLSGKSLKICISPKDWPGLSGEIDAWRRDRDERHLQHCSWLVFIRNDEPRGIRCGDEAAVSDKIKVLEWLDAFRLPIGYFRPVPEGIVRPDEQPGHFPDEFLIGPNIWEENGEPAPDALQPGGKLTLVDHYGLKAEILIQRHTLESEKEHPDDADYTGTGTAEGYTSPRPREIKVYMEKGKVSFLKLFRKNDDYQVFFGYPLWQEYFRDRAEIGSIYRKAIHDLILSCRE